MRFATLKYFSLAERTRIVSGIMVRKFFGPDIHTVKLLDNKALIEQVVQNGGMAAINHGGFTLSEQVGRHNKTLTFQLRSSGADEIIYRDIIQRNGGDYGLIPELAERLGIEINTIIDAGANIGTATAYLKSEFPEAKVICIEPEPGNFEALSRNIHLNKFEDDVQLCQNAFWTNNDELNIGIGIRGTLSKELSFGVVEQSEETVQVKGLTFKDCLSKLGTATADLVKIDIEGAEAALFNDEEGFKYMVEHSKLLAIELHDEAVDLFKFYAQIEALGMRHMHKGETTYCWKK